ncbi:MAG TPA: His-Xaa-Ser system radical SAM maturase HxsB [Oceanicaulis sp.]|nr:His-Xaa-Ser system radical SAM maturase HxsB [Oceanicaulis sp.]
MNIVPLRFVKLAADRFLLSDDGGRAFVSGPEFVRRYATGELLSRDREFLVEQGFAYEHEADLAFLGHARALLDRFARRKQLSYLILVPTLRCDLRCTYCQVSRVNADQAGFDWSPEILHGVLGFIDELVTDEIQIEFQGGEPLLRVDLLEQVANYCEQRFQTARFVVCTNLSQLDDRARGFLGRDNVHISTSLDGPAEYHQRSRTRALEMTAGFLSNLQTVVNTWGAEKVSALPTINPLDPPPVGALLDAYAQFGMRSIFLRPISHHGFARKSYRELRDESEAWNAYFDQFLDEVLSVNVDAPETEMFEEYYFSQVLRRCLRSGVHNHVDLRSPNPYGEDYLVVDYNGRLYPTDETRMMTRAGQIDLSVGDVWNGITERDRLDALNSEAFNSLDPDCVHCAFQPACGVDLIDDIARYGRRDIPRSATFFCRRHMHLFKRAWNLLLSDNPDHRRSLCAWLDVPYSEAAWVPVHD